MKYLSAADDLFLKRTTRPVIEWVNKYQPDAMDHITRSFKACISIVAVDMAFREKDECSLFFYKFHKVLLFLHLFMPFCVFTIRHFGSIVYPIGSKLKKAIQLQGILQLHGFI